MIPAIHFPPNTCLLRLASSYLIVEAYARRRNCGSYALYVVTQQLGCNPTGNTLNSFHDSLQECLLAVPQQVALALQHEPKAQAAALVEEYANPALTSVKHRRQKQAPMVERYLPLGGLVHWALSA